MILKAFRPFFFTALIFPAQLLASCSLQYEQSTNTKSSVPEIIFTNVTFSRYERNSQTLSLSATRLEEYKSDGAYFAQDAQFTTRDSNGRLDTTGTCGLLGILPEQNTYLLLKGVEIENASQNLTISSSAMQWNSQTEQLTFAQDDEVHFARDTLELSGTGFSASGVSGRFEFTGPVQGTITTRESEGNE